jgi:FMN phosphatase YigB (HAD superfamily)
MPIRLVAFDVGEVLVDNAVLPARRAGMVAVFLRRGPWGVIQATRPDVVEADLRIESLDELPGALSRVTPAQGGAP